MPTLVTTYIWDSKSHGTQDPKILIGPMGLQNPMGLESQLVPKLWIWLFQRCPRDFCPGTVPAIFVSVPSVSRASVPIQVLGPGIQVPFPIPEFEYQGIFLCTVVRSSFRRSLQSLNLCTPFCDASNLHKKHLSNPKIDKVLVPSH